MLGRVHGWRRSRALLDARPLAGGRLAGSSSKYSSSSSSSSSSSPGAGEQLPGDNGGKALTPRELGPYLRENLALFSPDAIRNFSIVAHIDHGKSTLADRLLEVSGNITQRERESAQHLDNLKVERERGITVKAQTASMVHFGADKPYLLNLVDTPGHVDFSYEVNRSLAACEGVLLLVDCSQGIQAQTLATYYAAKERGLRVVPVLTKIDMPHAQPEDSILSMSSLLDVDPDAVLLTSAKSGEGIADVLPAVIERLPPPTTIGSRDAPLRCLLVDSYYDDYRGTICLVKVVDGAIFPGDKICSSHQKTKYEVQETGVLLPTRFKTNGLYSGDVGYIIAGMKTTTEAKVGDTFYREHSPVQALPGFQEAKSMVFASMYPTDDCSFDDLRVAIEKLTLNDASVSAQVETSGALGMGFRCGFLGLLHMEVFHQRLSDEQNMQVLVTAPMVPYTVIDDVTGKESVVETPGAFPAQTKNYTILEPMVEASIITPSEYLGAILALAKDKRGVQTNLVYLEDGRVIVTIDVPWQEVVTNFYNELKTISSGYATLNYREIEPQKADIVKVDILINAKALDALSFVCHRSKAVVDGRALCQKLKKVIDRQQYEISIQASLSGKIFAKERIAPFRKDVLIKSGKTVGGGDSTRKKKLLAKQKEGKKRMKTISNVQLSQDAFWSVLSK